MCDVRGWVLPLRFKALCCFKVPYNSENKPRSLYFSKALLKGLIFGGAYIRRGLCTEGNLRFYLIGQAYSWKEIYRFCFVLLCV